MGPPIRVLIGVSVGWVPLAFLFDGVTVLVLPIRLGGSDAATTGLVSFVGLALGVAAQPLAGWLSDRLRSSVDRRVVLAATAVPAMAGIWLLAGTTGVVAAIAGYIVIQAAAGAMQGVQGALIPEHVPSPARGRAAGLKSAFDVGGAFAGFVVLGALLASGDVVGTGAVLTLIVLVAVALLWVLVPPRTGSPVTPRTGSQARGWPASFPALVLSRFLFLFGTYAVGRFMLFIVAERLGIDPERAADEAGWLLAMFTGATALAAVPSGWLADRYGRRGLMRIGSVLSAAGIAAFIPSAGLGGVAVAGSLMAAGTAAFATANWAAATDVVAPADAGRLMGWVGVATGVAAASAGLLGPLIDVAGLTPALGIAAVVTLAATLPTLGPDLATIQPLKEHR